MSESPPDPFAFQPVPSASNRHDGWTPDRQRGFIFILSKIGVVALAARAVGMSRKSAYALRDRAGPGSSFVRAWRDAQEAGRLTVDFAAFERAVHGVEEPYFYRGRQIGVRRVYDNRLLAIAYRASQRAQGIASPWDAGALDGDE
ncbi:MAG TPA: hypothetical protein VEZ20_16965 [Allosphingosinicella sp.]|jgi:hypothetical protein|nr:hypothetical protein [Allosphingosinicella sp.]